VRVHAVGLPDVDDVNASHHLKDRDMKKTLACVMFTGLFGCGGMDTPDGPELLPNLVIPDPPDNGMQIITPIVHDLAPGSDTEMCTWTDKFVSDTTDVKSALGFQAEPPGHHIVVFWTTQNEPPGTTRVCTDSDMASFRYVIGLGGQGELNEAPGDLVFRIPAGAQLVINHHYLNVTDETLDGQSAINVNFADPGPHTPSGSTAFLDTNLHVQPGDYSFDTSCTVDRTLKLWYMIPHMHEWGTNITVDIVRGENTQRMFDTIWDPSFAFHPPEIRHEPSDPFTVNPGDKVNVHCEWNNDTGRVLDFGFEMCVAYGQFVDDTEMGSWACDGGHWTDF